MAKGKGWLNAGRRDAGNARLGNAASAMAIMVKQNIDASGTLNQQGS
jgi:hypothetical protein